MLKVKEWNPNNLNVFRSKKTKGAKQDSQNQLQLSGVVYQWLEIDRWFSPSTWFTPRIKLITVI
jgi:hypothetical protein